MLESYSDPILGRAIHRNLEREKVSIPKHTTIHSFFVCLLTQRKFPLKLISCEMVQNFSILSEFPLSKATHLFPTASYRQYNQGLRSELNMTLVLFTRLFPPVSKIKLRLWKAFISLKNIWMHDISSVCNLCAEITKAMTSACAKLNFLLSSMSTDSSNAGVSTRTRFWFPTE